MNDSLHMAKQVNTIWMNTSSEPLASQFVARQYRDDDEYQRGESYPELM